MSKFGAYRPLYALAFTIMAWFGELHSPVLYFNAVFNDNISSISDPVIYSQL